jgi:CDP-paratose 2-epimerase
MRVLITGICGFAGSALALELKERLENVEIFGVDNLSRPGSEQNRHACKRAGIHFVHGDIRNPSDLELLPKADWVIDAAANPSVLAGVNGQASSRQLMEHNLIGTLNLLEYCKRHNAGLIMLSTSRVYSLAELSGIQVEVKNQRFVLTDKAAAIPGLSAEGVAERFSTTPPVSLYGSAKLASEMVILEYGSAFGFPVHVNRCGVLAGPGQFGKADQGIFSFWIHSYRQQRPLKYIGFDGLGHQVRDCLHPRDLGELLVEQMQHPEKCGRVLNVSGGLENSMSLAELTQWCEGRFGRHAVASDSTPRQYDVPWLVLDSTQARQQWQWHPATRIESVLEEIAVHAEQHPEWLDLASDT